MSIVTISRQVGSLGSAIAQELAAELHVDCADKTTLEKYLNDHGIPPEIRERFEEKRPSLWDALSFDKHRYLHHLKSAILDFAVKGQGVIVGRGSPVFLQGVPGVLHIKLVAPLDVRMARVREQNGCDDAHAKRIIHHGDHDRGGFYRYFFDVDWNAPDLYDLTINTGLLSAAQVVDLIRRVLESSCVTDDLQAFQLALSDRLLAHAVTSKILYDEQVPLRFFTATAENGVVTISGVTGIPEDVSRCAEIAATVPGVVSVVQSVSFVPDHVGLGW